MKAHATTMTYIALVCAALTFLSWTPARATSATLTSNQSDEQGVCATTNNQTNLVPWKGGRWFLSGANVPWLSGGFGADFGTVEEWGQHTYTPAAAERMFADLKASGVNSVRWWIFADGRGAPEFAATNGGAVTGLDAAFLPNMANAIELAAKYDIYVVFNLWSFDMLYNDSVASGRGEHSGGHRDLIVDAAKRKSFIDKALLPMLRYKVGSSGATIGSHPNVLGWDIINEPEWGIRESGSVNGQIGNPVSLAEMQRFVAEVSAAIHQNSNQLTTVGSASMGWNSDKARGAKGNWWGDAQLKPYHADGYLDFYQIHYYGWMDGDKTWSYSPLVNSWAAAGFDKPTVVGEMPIKDGATGRSLAALLDGLHMNCYAGAWGWSYDGVDSEGGWAQAKQSYAAFNAAHNDEVRIKATNPPPSTTALNNFIYLPLAVR